MSTCVLEGFIYDKLDGFRRCKARTFLPHCYPSRRLCTPIELFARAWEYLPFSQERFQIYATCQKYTKQQVASERDRSDQTPSFSRNHGLFCAHLKMSPLMIWQLYKHELSLLYTIRLCKERGVVACIAKVPIPNKHIALR